MICELNSVFINEEICSSLIRNSVQWKFQNGGVCIWVVCLDQRPAQLDIRVDHARLRTAAWACQSGTAQAWD